jgi:hypothetical protein
MYCEQDTVIGLDQKMSKVKNKKNQKIPQNVLFDNNKMMICYMTIIIMLDVLQY